MAKEREQYATKREFDSFSAKVDCIIAYLKVSERKRKERDERQQQGIEEIFSLLHCTKGLGSFIKTVGALTASITAIVIFFQNIKGWFSK